MADETQMLTCKIGVLRYGDDSGYRFEVEADDDKGRKVVRVLSAGDSVEFEHHEWQETKAAIDRAFEYLNGAGSAA